MKMRKKMEKLRNKLGVIFILFINIFYKRIITKNIRKFGKEGYKS